MSGTGGTGLGLHREPDVQSAILTTVPEGASVVPSGAAEYADGLEWFEVQVGGAHGWAPASFLDELDTADTVDVSAFVAPTAFLAGDQATVVGVGSAGLRIRASASFAAPLVGTVPAGAVLTIVEGPQADPTGALWYGLQYNGLRGWANERYLAPVTGAAIRPVPTPVAPALPATSATSASSGQGNAIVAAALLYLGVPYSWGGVTPRGWDCSGFIAYVVQETLGRTLPRTTQAQIGVGTPVAADDIRAGDLVFFANTYAPGITHVGIALGDGRFVHARSPTYGTVITSLADPYYGSHFAGARRL